MSQSFLHYSRHCIEKDDVDAVVAALNSDWLTTGPEVAAFESEIADYCGAKYAVSCSNGTTALHLAYLAAGLGPEDSIVTSPITFLATANAAAYCGARVYFVDIEPDTANLDPTEVRSLFQNLRKQGKRLPKLIVPVHFAGNPAKIEALNSIAIEFGASMIEDAAHALGASYINESGIEHKIGSCEFSSMTTFSFHPVKQITTGEGGAITTNSEAVYQKLLMLRGHGMVRSPDQWVNPSLGFDLNRKPNPWYYEQQTLGFNYRICDIQCALGRSQLRKLDRFVNKRRQLAEFYRVNLREIIGSSVTPLKETSNSRSAHHLFSVKCNFEKNDRSRTMNLLKERGIGTQVHYIPVCFQPFWSRNLDPCETKIYPHAEKYYHSTLSLPLYPQMTEADILRVIRELKSTL